MDTFPAFPKWKQFSIEGGGGLARGSDWLLVIQQKSVTAGAKFEEKQRHNVPPLFHGAEMFVYLVSIS